MKISMHAAIAVSLCTLFLSGCQGTPSTPPSSSTPTQQTTQPAPAITPESKVWSDKGLAAYQKFDYETAIAAYDKALDLDAKNYDALSGKGVALAMRGNASGTKEDVTAGITLIQQALAIAPDDVASFYNLALAYKIDGQYDAAIMWFQKVIDKDPNNTWSYYGIATIYGDQGKAKDAVTYLEKAATLDHNAVVTAAQTQSHFDAIRSDTDFQKLVSP